MFEVGGFEWKLEMYPYGDSQSDKTLSVFLCAVDRKQVLITNLFHHYYDIAESACRLQSLV